VSDHSRDAAVTRRRAPYGLVFLALVAATAIELAIAYGSLSRELRNAVFLGLSLVKAGLVAAFYMHLRSDSRVYTGVFLSTVVLVFLFVLLTIVI
jgi:caa(3)-type oxidase subunit IV